MDTQLSATSNSTLPDLLAPAVWGHKKNTNLGKFCIQIETKCSLVYLDPCSATCIIKSRLKAREGAEYQQGLSEVNLGKSPGMPILHAPNSWAVSRNVVKDVTTHRQWLCAHPHMASACPLHGKQAALISHPLKTRRLLSSLHNPMPSTQKTCWPQVKK